MGKKHSQKTKKLISINNIGKHSRKLTQDQKTLISLKTKEAMARPEVQQKQKEANKLRSLALKGKKQSKETIEKRRKANTGKKRTLEQCINIGRSKIGNKYNLGRHHTKETKKKISKSVSGENNVNWGKHFSKEHRAKISKSIKLFYQNKKNTLNNER